jgi:hypothetical protein
MVDCVVQYGYSRVELSFHLFLYNNHNKKFSKDSGLAEAR